MSGLSAGRMTRTAVAAAAALMAGGLLGGCQFLPGGQGEASTQQSQAGAGEHSGGGAGEPTKATSGVSGDDGAGDDGAQREPDGGGGTGGGEALPIDPFRGTSAETRDTLYFTSPSGKHKCAIGPDDTGCNSSALPKDAPDVQGVDGEPERPNAVVLQPGRKAMYAQTGDPAYEFAASNPGSGTGKVLEYGSAISLHGTTCSSAEAGITCTNGAHGFTLSSEKVTLH